MFTAMEIINGSNLLSQSSGTNVAANACMIFDAVFQKRIFIVYDRTKNPMVLRQLTVVEHQTRKAIG